MASTGAAPTLDMIMNLSRFHREHEKFYSQAPLEQAIALQRASRTLKTFADRWTTAVPSTPKAGSPFLGCEDLNEPAAIQADGVLFMEGEAEPAELRRLKRELGTLADDFAMTGEWLGHAMAASWESARPLVAQPALADVLGERHRIIANDWQAADLSTSIARFVTRALEIIDRVDFSPRALREDLAGARTTPAYLYAAGELLDRAADLAAQSATLVHDNERRWRVFRQRVEAIVASVPAPPEHAAR